MLNKPGWEQSLRRWQAFWVGEVADRPPIQIAIVAGESLDTGEPPSLDDTLARFDPLRNEPILRAAEQGLAQVSLLGLGGQSGAWPAALHVDDQQRQFGHHRQPDPFRLQR